jgi:hypothetical protein
LGEGPAGVGVVFEAVVIAAQGAEVVGQRQSAVGPVAGVVEVGGEGGAGAAGEAAAPVAGADVAVEFWSVPAATDSRSGCLVGYLGQRPIS